MEEIALSGLAPGIVAFAVAAGSYFLFRLEKRRAEIDVAARVKDGMAETLKTLDEIQKQKMNLNIYETLKDVDMVVWTDDKGYQIVGPKSFRFDMGDKVRVNKPAVQFSSAKTPEKESGKG